MGFLTTIGTWLAGSAGAGTAAAGASTAAIEAGGYAAVGGGIAAGAAPVATAAAAGGGGLGGILTTAAEAAAVAQGASALYTLATGAGRINVPPVPVNQPQVDTSVANAEQQALARREAAGGLNATAGPLGQGGAILNPSTLSQKSLLGA